MVDLKTPFQLGLKKTYFIALGMRDLLQQFKSLHVFNPFSTNVPLLYPLKTSENRRFFDVFWGYRNGSLVENGLMSKMLANNLVFETFSTKIKINKVLYFFSSIALKLLPPCLAVQ